MFNVNVEDWLKEIICKMNNFLNEELFNEVQQSLDRIIQNQMIYLNQFYIIISTVYIEAEYEEFEFQGLDDFKA